MNEIYAERLLPDELKSTKIYTWNDNSAKVNVYDTITKVKESFNVSISFPSQADGIMMMNKIFIMGGYGPCKSTYELSIDSKSVTKKANMLIARYYHSLCKYREAIFSIGGCDCYKALNDCEKYETKSDKWSSLPNLS